MEQTPSISLHLEQLRTSVYIWSKLRTSVYTILSSATAMIGSNGAKFVTTNISDYVRSLFYCRFASSSTDKVSIIGIEMELNMYLWQKLLFTCAIPVLAPKHLTSFMEVGDVASLRGDSKDRCAEICTAPSIA